MSEPSFGSAIQARLDELARTTDSPGEITRLYLGAAHRRAADLVMNWMRDAGMDAHITPLGDVMGIYAGSAPKARRLIIGSHIDSVRNAGRYDGTLEVVTGIEIVRRLNAAGRRAPFAIEVIAFGDEEGVRFATALTGSRAMAGALIRRFSAETDEDDVSRRQALKQFGCPDTPIREMKRSADDTIGYLEVHIEQGPVLEAEDLAVGVVTAINGCTRGSVTVTGLAGHAGTVPMSLRRDALTAAAEMALAVESAAKQHSDTVGTVGSLRVPGGAINTVPGRVEFTLDVRASDDMRRRDTMAGIEAACRHIATKRGVGVDVRTPYDVPAARCDDNLSNALARSIGRVGGEAFRLASGAGHDAMSFRNVLPFAMLFVRCRSGISSITRPSSRRLMTSTSRRAWSLIWLSNARLESWSTLSVIIDQRFDDESASRGVGAGTPSDNSPGDRLRHANRTAGLLEKLGFSVERHIRRLALFARTE